MEISYEQLKTITRGAAYIEETKDGYVFHRFTKEQEKVYKEYKGDNANARVEYCSGVRIAFKTNSQKLFIKGTVNIRLNKRKFYSFDLVIDGKLTDTVNNIPEDLNENEPLVDLPFGEFQKEFSLGGGEKNVELYLPWSAKVMLKKITIDDNATITPIKYDKLLICYGDSITQGYDAFNSSTTYASILSQRLGAEIFNKAIGGEVFFPELVEPKEDLNPDYITVAYGTNDFSKKDPADFKARCRKFYKNLSVNYPRAKIFAISPIYRGKYLTHPTTQFKSFFDVENEIKDIAESLPNVTFISGFDLVPHDIGLYTTGIVHPTNKGFEYYGKNIADKIISLI